MADLQMKDTDALADLSFDSDEDLLRWLQSARTPLSMVDMREGRGGQTFYYIRQQHVTQILNRICGHNWDFEVLRERVDEDQVTVLGRLTLRIGEHEIVKSQYGGSDVKRAKDDAPLSVGDDFKSAASDALKKCAQMIGVGLDLSLPIQDSTMKRLHATGKEVFGEQWDKKRRWSIRVLTGGSKQSSKELLDIEGRILVGVMKKDPAPIVKQARRKLR